MAGKKVERELLDKLEQSALILVTADGEVWQLIDAVITGGTIRHILRPRTKIIELMDEVGVRDDEPK